MPEVTDPRLLQRLNTPQPGLQRIGPANPKTGLDITKTGLDISKTGQEIQRNAATLPYEAPKAAADLTKAQGDIAERPFARGDKLRSDFRADPNVKRYGAVIPQLMAGLQTAPNAAGDNSLIYAYAKIMDPDSAVREAEGEAAASTAGFWDAKVEQFKKNFGFDEARGLPAGAAANLRTEMNRKVAALAKSYGVTRSDYQRTAKRQAVNPDDVVGGFPGEPFFQKYDQLRKRGFKDEQASQLSSAIAAAENGGRNTIPPSELKAAEDYYRQGGTGPVQVNRPAVNDSPLSQGLSGVNEGIASLVGAPVDIANMGLGLGARGINAIANTNLQAPETPIMGSDWLRQQMQRAGAIGPESQQPGMPFVRRVGQSVGANLIPAGATARTGGQLGSMLLSGLGGGIGAATAREVAPGNPYAEMAGEIVGGGVGAAPGLMRNRQAAQRQIEAAIPSTEKVKERATQLYQQAEAGGTTADPMQTQALADQFRQTLQREGVISPTGRVSEVHPKAKEALQLSEDYSQGTMNPVQMQTMRKIVADAANSQDPAESRIGGLLLEKLDQWINPLAPGLSEARNVASRYLQAQELEEARRLAGSRAGQFSGSGFENALRTEYRALDRGAIKGQKNFTPEVVGAIENVARGTPASNFARGLGKMAPTGAISGGISTAVPFGIGNVIGGPGLGALLSGATNAIGIGGRRAATNMGMRNADLAELIARNGGAIPQADVLTPEMRRLVAAGLLGQGGQYLNGEGSP